MALNSMAAKSKTVTKERGQSRKSLKKAFLNLAAFLKIIMAI
eukprot:CAMPEP_0202942658 /NCGR_PEP_ID=MMETSP1395-20130829/2888_1 /ASSEMBLY_ACC=CAM_ASM_000871 /TAXON_ID=5961 /ORGANISM="Blepharisma japonicum, Strain Stock R1072" /LENGTH=41 /DNA_ID= /DNA_START= /DNA_END= /DNA_ORIENTATION=